MTIRTHTLLVGAIALSCASVSSADISYTQKITVDAAGGMSFFASEGEVVTQVSGDRSRTDTTMNMKSRLAGLAGDGKTGTIVRLDKSNCLEHPTMGADS